jgi:hypothetical protein
MKLYRISAGINGDPCGLEEQALLEVVLDHAADLTMRRVQGFWNGQPVHTYELDVASDSQDYIEGLARAVGTVLDQDCVMVTEIGHATYIKTSTEDFH